jgi:membrane-bound lytic murein transglycosylase B
VPRHFLLVIALVALAPACGPTATTALARAPLATTSTTAPPSTTTTTTVAPPLGGPDGAATPSELATRASAAEAVVRDPASIEAQLAPAAFELQVLYRQLARSPDWDAPVLAAMPDVYRSAVSLQVSARREFRSMHRTLSATLPAWRIVDPVASADLLAHYKEGEAIFGVPWNVLAAVNLVETGMGRIRGASVAGAQGPMQFMPATWDAFGEGDINDPHDAILAAARYLASNGGGSGDINNALYRYNHSERYVRGVLDYAAIIADDPLTFRAFYHWQIVYLSEVGDIWLPTGYEQEDRLGVADYLADNPDHLLTGATG